MFDEDEIGYLGFASHELEAQKAGWLQSRYYSDDESDYVRDFLSFNEIFEICPFEVGVNRVKEKRRFKALLKELTEDLELTELLPKRFAKLSNGEMRRVLLAKALLKEPKKLILDDPMGGLDPKRRDKFRAFFKKLSERGLVLEIRGEIGEGQGEGEGLGNRSRSTAEEASKIDTSVVDLKTRPRPVVEFKNINLKFGKRVLFKDFSWTIREGERWVLRGENGAGKTTLMALITGDSPLAYSLDVTVFGKRREVGSALGPIRKKIGMISPEMQAYLGKSPEELLALALNDKIKLLILDEPCMNLDKARSAALLKKVDNFLSSHPSVTAICIAHRSSHIPKNFNQRLTLTPSL